MRDGQHVYTGYKVMASYLDHEENSAGLQGGLLRASL